MTISKTAMTVMLAFLVVACTDEHHEVEPVDNAERGFLSENEREAFVRAAESAIGYKYTWGGQSKDVGFDCSGLIVWALNSIGIDHFAADGYLVHDITAQKFYDDNVEHMFDIRNLERGDLIFFDADQDGHIEHMSIFDKMESLEEIWVIDAYSVVWEVAHRQVENFWGKNPSFGRLVVYR